MKKRSFLWVVMLAGALLTTCVLGLQRTTAAPQGGQPPFANSVEQRGDMVRELREIKELLKEQNALLREMSKNTGHATQP